MRATRLKGEESAALQPSRELGLQVEPDPERCVTEDVVNDAQLVDHAAFLTTQDRMWCLAGDRGECHRPAFS